MVLTIAAQLAGPAQMAQGQAPQGNDLIATYLANPGAILQASDQDFAAVCQALLDRGFGINQLTTRETLKEHFDMALFLQAAANDPAAPTPSAALPAAMLPPPKVSEAIAKRAQELASRIGDDPAKWQDQAVKWRDAAITKAAIIKKLREQATRSLSAADVQAKLDAAVKHLEAMKAELSKIAQVTQFARARAGAMVATNPRYQDAQNAAAAIEQAKIEVQEEVALGTARKNEIDEHLKALNGDPYTMR